MTSQARPHWQNKKEAGVQILSSRTNLVYGYEVFTEATPVFRSADPADVVVPYMEVELKWPRAIIGTNFIRKILSHPVF